MHGGAPSPAACTSSSLTHRKQATTVGEPRLLDMGLNERLSRARSRFARRIDLDAGHPLSQIPVIRLLTTPPFGSLSEALKVKRARGKTRV